MAFTFGCEIKFMVAILKKGIDQDPHPMDPRNPYIIDQLLLQHFVPRRARLGDVDISQVLPFENLVDVSYDNDRMEEQVRFIVADLLRQKGIFAVSDSADEWTTNIIAESRKMRAGQRGITPEEVPAERALDYLWDVYPDRSARLAQSRVRLAEDLAPYRTVGVELRTPVLPFRTESIKHVQEVLKIIRQHFRVMLSATCGVHVHVGKDLDGFTSNDMKRLMPFLWAAAPRLDGLHPPHMGTRNWYAPGLRTYSRTANHGDDERWIVEHGLTRFPAESEPLAAAAAAAAASTGKGKAAGAEDPYVDPFFAPAGGRVQTLRVPETWRGRDRFASTGVARILTDPDEALLRGGHVATGGPGDTAGLRMSAGGTHLRTLGERGAYNYNNAYVGIESHALELWALPKTVEFRQAAGSLAGEHVGHWIRTCVGIVEFCLGARLGKLLDVLGRLDYDDPLERDPRYTSYRQGTNMELLREARRNSIHKVVTDPMLRETLLRDPLFYSVHDLLQDIGLPLQADYFQQLGAFQLPPGPYLNHKNTKHKGHTVWVHWENHEKEVTR